MEQTTDKPDTGFINTSVFATSNCLIAILSRFESFPDLLIRAITACFQSCLHGNQRILPDSYKGDIS